MTYLQAWQSPQLNLVINERLRILLPVQKLSAILLLIPLVALCVVTVRLPAACESGKGMTCQASARAGTATGMHPCCASSKRASNTTTQLPAGKNGGSPCVDCPFCCLVTFHPFIHFDFLPPEAPVNHTGIYQDYLSDYLQFHWKPPGNVDFYA